MWIGLVFIIVLFAAGVAIFIYRSSRMSEIQKYYDAASMMIKETCLNNAIRNQMVSNIGGWKIMIYLKWKTREKQGFVFDPDAGVRIGRIPGENEICIRENNVSGRHCRILMYNGQLLLQDLNSTNGTWIKRGFRKKRVVGAEPLLSGDRILIGSIKMTVTVFSFDMTYI